MIFKLYFLSTAIIESLYSENLNSKYSGNNKHYINTTLHNRQKISPEKPNLWRTPNIHFLRRNCLSTKFTSQQFVYKYVPIYKSKFQSQLFKQLLLKLVKFHKSMLVNNLVKLPCGKLSTLFKGCGQ